MSLQLELKSLLYRDISESLIFHRPPYLAVIAAAVSTVIRVKVHFVIYRRTTASEPILQEGLSATHRQSV
jgi:hypothetical protein